MATGLGVAAKAVLLVLAPVMISVALYSPKDFSPAELPPEHSFGADVSAPRHDARVLAASERVGEGLLPGPEDLAYDAAGGWLYTGCADGWVRRVSVPGGDVEDWASTGGRPLGVVLAGDGGIVVADADKEEVLEVPHQGRQGRHGGELHRQPAGAPGQHPIRRRGPVLDRALGGEDAAVGRVDVVAIGAEARVHGGEVRDGGAAGAEGLGDDERGSQRGAGHHVH
ncbi:hypothetical protein ACQJBY_006717 [Aegilops geniculata]